MRRLLLLRHAKAEAGTPDQEDHDRALTERGHADAAAMARHLAQYAPDRILCSTSLRTRQTVAAVLAQCPAQIVYLDALYLAPPGKIIGLVQDAADADGTLLVVAHNPGLEQGASLLARDPVQRKEQEHHDLLEEKFPTAALAVLEFDLDHWRKIAPCSARLVEFIRPRDL